MSLVDVVSVLAATIRLATPLVLATLGGLFSERAGIVALGLEGMMLAAAFAAACIAHVTGSAWLALAAGMGVSMALSLIHGFASVTQRGDQVVSGMALNILVAGLCPTLGLAWFQQGGQTPALGHGERFMPIVLPFADGVAGVPVLGPIWNSLIGGHNLIVYLAALLLPLSAWLLYRTSFGLRIRAVGENPHAVDAAGLSVAGLRYGALALSGILVGLAGADLSIAEGAGFGRDMTAGRGYVALAALIFGKWRPVPAVGACLLFAFCDALQVRLQGVALPVVGVVPVQLVEALPYLLTVVLLAGFIGAARAPRAIGLAFVKTR
ncbi:MAG TPA: ABC transporter permease [Aliidongia sp.]|uniref:ABC transporter permease n=1 Tax=Aliidongia sp. TaxID=1914230 RepID=UPI002DDCD3A1|nr:ABC transporter permease [Aliidongia sp.]HEV2678842.1 ABC transporter permease [Aliidongia sp.]